MALKTKSKHFIFIFVSKCGIWFFNFALSFLWERWVIKYNNSVLSLLWEWWALWLVALIIKTTISDKIVDTFKFLTPYFATVIPFCPPTPSPRAMLYRNCCDLGEQTSNIEWGSGVFSTIFFALKRVVLVGALIVLWKDNVATNYVTDWR